MVRKNIFLTCKMSPYVAFMTCFVVEVGRATCRYFWLYVALKREEGNVIWWN
jgi:hypothetical protein